MLVHILEYILIAILHPEAVFQSHLILGKLVCSILLKSFVCFVLFEKLVTCFKTILRPGFALGIDTLDITKGDEKQERLRARCEGQKAGQQGTTRLNQGRSTFDQKYQTWLNQMNTCICEDVDCSIFPVLPSFLLREGIEHLINSSDAIQDFYDKANIGPGEFEKDRKLWDFLEKEITCRFAILRIAMLDGRRQFLERISEAKQR